VVIEVLESTMDRDNPTRTKAGSGQPDSEIDALAERLSSTWSQVVPTARGATGQILQRLAHGRLNPVTVETKRAKRRPAGPR
jgi:hypothetical protein